MSYIEKCVLLTGGLEVSFSICTMDHPKFIVPNQKEESISIRRVNILTNQIMCVLFSLFSFNTCVVDT